MSQNSHTDAQNDFTARVYAEEKVNIFDAFGKTSNDEKVYFRTGGYLKDGETTTEPEDDLEIEEDDEVPDDDLEDTLEDYISLLEKSPSNFKVKKPKSYFKVQTSWKDSLYFLQISPTTERYDLDFRITFKSQNSEIASTEDVISATKYGKEMVQHVNICKLRPYGEDSCSYLLATQKVTDIKIKLVKWQRAVKENLPVF